MTRPRKNPRRERDSNPGSSVLEADALPLGQRGGRCQRHSSSLTGQLAESGRPDFLMHGRYLRYIYFVRRWQTKLLMHGRYLRYIYFVRRWQTKLLAAWKVPQIHLLRQKVADQTSSCMEGTSDTFTSSEGGRPNFLIHGRYLRYIYFVRRCRPNFLLHGRYLRYIYFVRRWQTKLLDTWKVPQIHLLRQKVADQTF